MAVKTFPGGKHVEGHKELTRNIPVKEMPLPKQVVIPLSQHTGSPCRPLVKKGDNVKTGTKIGEGKGFITSCIHSSVSGTVKDIVEYNHPVLGRTQAVVIDTAATEEKELIPGAGKDYNDLSKEEILAIIKEAGIVGLGGAAFPTNVKLSPPNPVDTLIINGVECEPYLTCDFRLMMERSEDILKGILILKKVLGVPSVFIGIEQDKPEAISALRNKIVEKSLDIRVVALKTKYPQGAEKQLIKAVTGREVAPGKLPFDAGVVVSNVGTSLAVFEAVSEGKPLYERVLTVTGRSVNNPANLKVRIGTRFSEIIEFCGGTKQEPAKIIMGGPMMGLAQFTDDVPVIKGTSGILILSQEEVPAFVQGPCIRCGRCVDICPMGMSPYALSVIAEAGLFSEASGYNPKDCIECGSCTFTCPSKRRILESIKLIKAVTK